MSSPSPRQDPPRLSDRLGSLVVMVGVLTLTGLAIADFANDGRVSEALIGALLVLSLTFGGYGADRVLGKLFR